MKISRNTKQKAIIEKVINNTRGIFTVETILKESKKLDSSLGIATIYRFLKDLKRKNQIYSYICEKRTLYSKEKSSHCHYICEKTNKITHFEIKNLDFLKKLKLPGSISSIQLEIKGECHKCSAN
ncbi:MAG: transcriptional repressor [Nanoarchaeota archaeon]